MCLPWAAAGGLLSLAGSAAGFAQQSSQAAAQQGHADAMAQRNQQIARTSAGNQFSAIQARVREEGIQRNVAAQDLARNAIQARSRVSAAAVEAGVSGGAVDAVLADFGRQEGEFLERNRLSQEFAREQADRDLLGVNLGLDSRLLASTPDIIQGPDLIGASLGAFSSAFGTTLSIDSSVKQAGGETFLL